MRSGDQRGAAAIEFLFMLLILLPLLGLAGPAISAIQEQARLGRAAGAAVRFASATPETKRLDCDGNAMAKDRRPSAAQVVREAECARFGTDPVPAGFSVTVSPDPTTASPGQTVTVTVSNTVDLGVLGVFLGRDSVTVSATSIGVEE